jgi:hypothetical protein
VVFEKRTIIIYFVRNNQKIDFLIPKNKSIQRGHRLPGGPEMLHPVLDLSSPHWNDPPLLPFLVSLICNSQWLRAKQEAGCDYETITDGECEEAREAQNQASATASAGAPATEAAEEGKEGAAAVCPPQMTFEDAVKNGNTYAISMRNGPLDDLVGRGRGNFGKAKCQKAEARKAAAEAAAKVEAPAAAPSASASAAAESAAAAKVALIQFFLIECSEDISTWLMNFIKRTPDFLKSVSMKAISDLTAATEATAAKKASKVAEVAAEVAGKLAKEGQLSDEVAKDLKVAAEAAAAKAAKVEAGAAKKLTHLQSMGRPKGVSRKLKRPLRDQPPVISSSSLTNYQLLTNYQFSKDDKKEEYMHPEVLPNEEEHGVLDFIYS